MNIDAKRLIEIIEDSGYEAASYSGRGMYGMQCVSLRDADGLHETLSNLVRNCNDIDEAAEIIGRANTDSLGLGIIIYWPRARWEGEEEAGDDEDES